MGDNEVVAKPKETSLEENEKAKDTAVAIADANVASVEAPAGPPKTERVRMYYIDWARTLAIHLVIYIHCINIAK